MFEEIKDKAEEIRDEVEEKYIDPLKKEIEEHSEAPLSFLAKHGQKVVLGFVAAVVLAVILFAIF